MTVGTSISPGVQNASSAKDQVVVGSGGRGLRTVVILGAVLVVIAGFAAFSAVRRTTTVSLGPAPAKLPVISAVPDFTLTERSGRSVSRADLLGSVWVADFIFTRCAGPCPKLSELMRGVQYALKGETGVKLVSVCLDPENDTPPALVHYAKRFNAEADRWWFLTDAEEKRLHALVREGFLQSVVPAKGDDPLLHSTYLVTLDRSGRIRAAHDGLGRDAYELVLRDVRALSREPVGDDRPDLSAAP